MESHSVAQSSMDHQHSEHPSGSAEKKMITPQIIQTESEHSNLLVEIPDPHENIRNHHPYPNFSQQHLLSSPLKYKTEPEYQSSVQVTEQSSSSSSSKKPKKEIDSTKAYKCPLCAYSFNRRDHLTRHSLVHSKLKPYHCTYCSKDFTRNDHLRRHQQRVHGEETAAAAASMPDITQRFVCQECKAIFTSSGHLRVHMENKHHSDFTDFINQHHDQTQLKLHSQDGSYVIVDGKKRPVCQLCSKSFAKKDHLRRHINNIHAGITTSSFDQFTPEQSFNCTLCGKRFSRPEFLRRHLDDVHNHSGHMEIINHLSSNNPYNGQGNSSTTIDPMFPVPPPHLNSMFGLTSFENTSTPIATSTPIKVKNTTLKTHSCNICSKNFTRRYHLTRHQKTLHGGVFDNPQQNNCETDTRRAEYNSHRSEASSRTDYDSPRPQ
ncbi:CLUMA_CG012192, isoform A [Clunio marinus]|uniref:CLUMA_CG012192, isoform A n=1 Tax=Clunio marinus TaxID=568069 RepID=A0A1J1IF90_9DIPT|nr:CLUMA_CG012192, isoform A [Clunio marinus]